MHRRTRTGAFSYGWLMLALVVALSLVVAACGGDDDDDAAGESGDSAVPVVDGADQIHSAAASEEDIESFEGVISDGRTLVYTTNMSVAEVATFYQEQLPDGWELAAALPGDDISVVQIFSGNVAATAIIGSGSAITDNPMFSEEDRSDLNLGDVEDDETAIIIAQFTCAELVGSACADAITQ